MPRRARPKELPKTLTADQVDALMAMPNLDVPTGLRDRALMELMYRTGLRVSEACAIHLRDWRQRDRQIHVRPEVGKGGLEAYVYLDDVAEDFLQRWKAVRRGFAAGKPHLFTTLAGNALDRRDVWEMIVRRAAKAGLGHVHPHMLRHSFATSLLADGFNVREVQRLMRHADLRTTAIYLEVRDEELAAKIRGRGRS